MFNEMKLVNGIKINIKGLFIFLAIGALTGCAIPSKKDKADCELTSVECSSIKNLCPGASKTGKIGAIRSQSIRDTALSMGARGGLAWKACEINRILLKQEKLLNRVFNFNGMLLDKNVLPPVLTEGRNTLQLSGGDAIRIADRTYQILRQAKFVTAAPTWREYLWMSYSPPENPDKSLLPKSQAERLLWKKYVDEGWKCGIQQAETIFRENVGRLKRDYEGMIRYRTLLAQYMVSPPFVAELEMGVTGGGSDLTVNDRVLRITAFPSLQNDSRSWKTEITPNE